MNLNEYFENTKEGRVDAAVYARPKVLDGENVVFIMRDRLTHANLQSNPHAAYLFMEEGSGGYFATSLSEACAKPASRPITHSQNHDQSLHPILLLLFKKWFEQGDNIKCAKIVQCGQRKSHMLPLTWRGENPPPDRREVTK